MVYRSQRTKSWGQKDFSLHYGEPLRVLELKELGTRDGDWNLAALVALVALKSCDWGRGDGNAAM